MDVVIQKVENPSQQPTQVKKKWKVSRGSFEEQVASLNLASTLSPLFDELDPKPGFLRIWPDKVWVVSMGVCPLLSAATDK